MNVCSVKRIYQPKISMFQFCGLSATVVHHNWKIAETSTHTHSSGSRSEIEMNFLLTERKVKSFAITIVIFIFEKMGFLLFHAAFISAIYDVFVVHLSLTLIRKRERVELMCEFNEVNVIFRTRKSSTQ